MDFDQVSRDDAVGSVFIDLNPLTTDEVDQIAGWFPIFDTLRYDSCLATPFSS